MLSSSFVILSIIWNLYVKQFHDFEYYCILFVKQFRDFEYYCILFVKQFRDFEYSLYLFVKLVRDFGLYPNVLFEKLLFLIILNISHIMFIKMLNDFVLLMHFWLQHFDYFLAFH